VPYLCPTCAMFVPLPGCLGLCLGAVHVAQVAHVASTGGFGSSCSNTGGATFCQCRCWHCLLLSQSQQQCMTLDPPHFAKVLTEACHATHQENQQMWPWFGGASISRLQYPTAACKRISTTTYAPCFPQGLFLLPTLHLLSRTHHKRGMHACVWIPQVTMRLHGCWLTVRTIWSGES
jgi:hypothetical protein